MARYRIAAAFSIVAVLFCIPAVAGWVFLVVDTDELAWAWTALIATLFVAPCLLAVLLCAWNAGAAPVLMVLLSVVYAAFVFGTATSGGILLWPAALAMLIAAVNRLVASQTERQVRVLAADEILGRGS
jgi:hypothetical protein